MLDTRTEAKKIYSAIFKKDIPSSILYHFENISKKIDSFYPEHEVQRYYSYIEKIHDLEALELATRYLKKIPILTVKFKVMVYLAETLPENYAVFVNEHPRRFLACIFLIYSVCRTSYKMAKGMALMVIYNL